MAEGDITLTVSVPSADEIVQGVATALEGAPVTLRVIQPPLEPSGRLTLIRGDSYLAADGNAILVEGDWGDLTGWELVWTARPYGDGAVVTVDTITSPVTGQLRLELTAADTGKLTRGGKYLWDVQATRGESVRTIVRGPLEALTDASA